MKTLWTCAAASLCIAALAGCATGALQVSEVGSFHVGGRAVTLSGLPEKELSFTPGAPPLKLDPNGDFEVEALYARYTRLASPKAKYPLLMWHGGGLSGVTFETKPDGAPGWEDYFLRAGYDVYVSDAVERGRASWARYPEIFKSEPFFRPKKEGWELFRIGDTGSYATDPVQRKTFPGTQFPVAAFDQFAKQAIPRWGTNDAATQAAYDAYVQKVCPCVILVHSQGGNFAFNSALKYPDKVKALVAVETSGSPNPDTTDFARIKGVPMLWVWGDNLDKFPFWGRITAQQERFRTNLVRAGGTGDRLLLPEVAIHGNTHMLMMDRNSDQIGGLIDQWLTRQGIKK
ncbi:esterase [Variovorax sp. J22R24]|uniref:alpha/beta fold hydrolase n=1 Tax=Variovorax gracilis TaxID=3053502 RepID=UPI002575491F|nr:alpha/beta fold hydrolase [Variovorax sp. J22R24]MDM0108804.1 esterase [Variovorax sp. J22R24]